VVTVNQCEICVRVAAGQEERASILGSVCSIVGAPRFVSFCEK